MAEWRQGERPLLRLLVRELRSLPDWELVLLRTRVLETRPPLPRPLRGRVHVRTALDGASRAEVLREAAVFVPAVDGMARVAAEARAAGAAVVAPAGGLGRPELVAAETARLLEDETFRDRRAREGRDRPSARASRRSPTRSRRCTAR